MSLNSAQIEATSHNKGPCMVLAGPGSGKTTVITKRIEYLIKKHKVKPEQILVITFSKAAAKEMRDRFHALYPGKTLPVTFGTFHGIYYGILKWAYQLTNENIISEEQKLQLLQQIVRQTVLDMEDEKDFLLGIAEEISVVKNNQIPLEEYHAVRCEESTFCEIYNRYEEQRKQLRKIDFDDMLVLTYQLFQKRPEILRQWQEKFSYILIDEFQDINQVQYDVIRMLALPENNLFVVGDDDQSIYQFRGARPDIMLHFPEDYSDCKQIVLGVNYRSTKSIVRGAGRVIDHNKGRYPKQIVTNNEQGATVHIQEVRNPIEESKYVVGQIQKTLASGVSPTEIAVLFRTNLEARMIIETCMEYHISFYMKEHFSNLYEHFIAQDLMTYMRIAFGDYSRKSFLKIMNRPNRYISRESVEKAEISFEDLRKYYHEQDWMQDRIDQFEADLRVIRKCTPYAAIQYIRKRIGYDVFLREYAHKHRIQLRDLYDVMSEVEERAKEYKTIEEWFDHIEDYTQKLRQQAQYREQSPDAITLLTMHGAKGLEFHTVFVIGANEDITPYKKAKTRIDMEEERRLFYVAMTRAKKRLVISYSRERNGKHMEPSRFVTELMGV